MKNPAVPTYPRRRTRHGDLYTPTESSRPYDPARDGWNTHKIRTEPTVDELIAREDAFGEDF